MFLPRCVRYSRGTLMLRARVDDDNEKGPSGGSNPWVKGQTDFVLGLFPDMYGKKCGSRDPRFDNIADFQNIPLMNVLQLVQRAGGGVDHAACAGFRRLSVICPYTFCPFTAPKVRACLLCQTMLKS